MTHPTIHSYARAAAASLLFGVLTMAMPVDESHAAEKVKWTLVSKPSNGGAIRWERSSPPGDGTARGSKAVTFDKDTFLHVWAEPNPGFELVSLTKDDQEFVWFLDAENHFEFGPVGGSHRLTATFVPVLPTVTIDLNAPLDNPDIPRIVDLTGSYSGISPTLHEREYSFDAAMDETGKVIGMGTIEGVVADDGGDLTGTGKIASVGGEPTYTGKTKFSGTRDGVAVSGRGSGRGPAELQGPGGDVAAGSMTYSGKAGGIPIKDKNVPVQTTVDEETAANVRRDWSITLDIVERAKSKSGKPYVAASAVVTLPNGDVIDFAEKRARYTARGGLKILFKKGTNLSRQPTVTDRKTKITIKKMTLEKTGDIWNVTGGTLKYQFLGQRGDGDVTEFLVR